MQIRSKLPESISLDIGTSLELSPHLATTTESLPSGANRKGMDCSEDRESS